VPAGDLILIAVASLVGSFVKSVTGMGYPLLAVPFLSMFIGVHDAVVILAFPNTVANLMINIDARESRHETRDLGLLGGVMVVGAVLGVLLLVYLPETPLLLALVATIIMFVIHYFRAPTTTMLPATTRRWAPPVGLVAGVMQGAIGISGPIVAMWIHGYRLSKNGYVYAVTMLFLLAGTAQLVALAATGEFTSDRLTAVGVAFVAAMSMVPVGTRLRSRLAGEVFEHLVVMLLIVSAISLLVRVAT